MTDQLSPHPRPPGRLGRAGRRERVAADGLLPKPAYLNLQNPYAPIAQFTTEQIEAIHEASLTILEETGMRVLHEDARAYFRAAGALVDETNQRVRVGRDIVMNAVGQAPSRIHGTSRNPLRDVHFGGRNLNFATVGGPPNVADIERGKRPGTLADFENFVKLSQTYDVVHIIAAAVEPLDVDPRQRHIETTLAQLLLSDKFPFIYARGRAMTEQAFALIQLARGLDEAAFRQTVCCYTVINTNSPLQLDRPMSRGIIDFASAGQLLVITPFTLAGAMAPISLPGALALQNAEALFGIALAQLVRPGAPVLYGGFTSNVDMKSGAPAFGTPEYVKAAFATGQLARRYGLPWRSSAPNAANWPDAQAAYETQMSLWGAVMGGADAIIHSAGWLEGGLTASYEKFIIDVEMLQMFAELMQPIKFDPAELAMDAIREVGPGGHFFGAQHTMQRYEHAFYAPLLSDWRNYGVWQADGARDTTQRAYAIWKKALADYKPPPIDSGLAEALQACAAKQRGSGSAELEQ